MDLHIQLKKFTKYAYCFLLLALLSACGATEKFLSEHKNSHNEKIEAFLFTDDFKSLVAVGHDYHYLIKVNQDIERILKAEWRSLVMVNNIEINASDAPIISGFAYLTIPAGVLSEQDRKQAISYGFFFSQAGEGEGVGTVRLNGTRHSKENLKLPAEMASTSISVDAKVSEGLSRTTKALLTPFTVAADGALLVVGTPVFVGLAICGDRGCGK
ncbi:MAG TPA: hypothetical protein VJ508_18160 [Saprospiraceae bacterium]|nr:hypothetical protein [Saprospiraceae bacterium]